MRLKPFGSETFGIARSRRSCDQASAMVPASELPGLLPSLDVLISVLPGGPQTDKSIDAGMLSRLKPGAILVNVGRGP